MRATRIVNTNNLIKSIVRGDHKQVEEENNEKSRSAEMASSDKFSLLKLPRNIFIHKSFDEFLNRFFLFAFLIINFFLINFVLLYKSNLLQAMRPNVD